MSRITGVIVALATATALMSLPSSASMSTAPMAAPPPAELPRAIKDGVELTLTDGDLFQVWSSPGHKTVWGKRRDAATGRWGERQVVFRQDYIECGRLSARTASGAVAITAACDSPTFRIDQAPGHPQAIYSADTLTWTSRELEQEADEPPGISDGGTTAIWPQDDGNVVTWSGVGFADQQLDPGEVNYPDSVAATITDAGDISYFFLIEPGTPCRVGVMTRTGDAAPVRQELLLEGDCSNATSVGTSTVWWDDTDDLLRRTTVTRADSASPWAVTEPAPIGAPGLVDGRMGPVGVSAPGVPLLALGSARGHQIIAQRFDPSSQTWSAPAVVHDAGSARCRWSDGRIDPPLRVIAVGVTCGERRVMLTTADGVTWRVLRMATTALGVSADGRHVAVPMRNRTSIISPGHGVVTIPAGAHGRCELVVPDGPDAAVVLTAAGRNLGWPTVLKRSGPSGWRARTSTRLPTFPRPCRLVRPNLVDPPYRYEMFNPRHTYTVQILERNGRWTVRRTSY